MSALSFALALLLFSTQTQTSGNGPMYVTGVVVDASGAPVAGAAVRAVSASGGPFATASTDARGAFSLSLAPADYTVTIESPGFAPHVVALRRNDPASLTHKVTLEIAGVRESIRVEAPVAYKPSEVRSATRTPTPLREVPQAISVVTRSVIADQRMQGIADVVRYMPGVGIAQGEGNRDTPVLRGNSTTADFFVDGIRDDVQYMRDLYNVDRVEALKGPNAMIFGRGGAGGVINRVTRQAEWGSSNELTLQAGSWDDVRVSADLGRHARRGAARLTGVYEQSQSYRSGVGLERYGLNPTAALRLGNETLLRAGYEYFHDERTADRGVSSLNGRPVSTAPSVFFGDPWQSRVRATINVFTGSLDHAFTNGASLRSRVSFGDYDKFYQNVFPGLADAVTQTVRISAYNDRTSRRSLFSQTDVIVPVRTGRVSHTFLAGAELGRQVNDNLRNTGFFTSLGPGTTSFAAPLSAPTISVPITFRPGANDADNHGVATAAAAYLQDQLRLGARLRAVAGLRVDRFVMDLHNNRTAADLSNTDLLWSPRVGVVFNALSNASVYASYSLSHLPRAGEQLTSLSATNRALDPEQFRNYEVGAKWDVSPAFGVTAAVYRLDRHNIAVPDPTDPMGSLLIDAQRTRGLELGASGQLTSAWSLAGGYAWQHGEITQSLSPTAQAGASIAQLPRHSFSLWNKYQAAPRFAAALGVIHRGDAFTSTDNAVVLPAFTRVDAAVFFDLTAKLRAQVNVENALNARYFASAHNNTNILPGAPRAIRISLVTRF